MLALLAFAALILAHGLVSRSLNRLAITGPMVFVAAGLILSPNALDAVHIDLGGEAVALLAEVTLAIVLFTDAARIDLGAVRHRPEIPVRLLGVAMPLTIGLGVLAGAVLLTDLEVWEAAIAAAILAPTDAALGQAVVTNPEVPARVRQGLNVESGLNDGLSVPFLFIFVALAGIEGQTESTGYWMRFVAEQIGLGVATGLVIGIGGAWLMERALRVGTMDAIFAQLAGVALAVLALLGAEEIGGNGFIAAFVAGLVGAQVCRGLGAHLLDFSEDEGRLLTLGTFFIFGVAFAGPALDALTWQIALYAVLSLTLVRMIPVIISMTGLGLTWATRLFIGWFGPRGLASIVLALIVLEERGVLGREEVFTIATFTVLLSVYAHGLTARPLARAFGAHCARTGDADAPEMLDVMPIPTRFSEDERTMA